MSAVAGIVFYTVLGSVLLARSLRRARIEWKVGRRALGVTALVAPILVFAGLVVWQRGWLKKTPMSCARWLEPGSMSRRWPDASLKVDTGDGDSCYAEWTNRQQRDDSVRVVVQSVFTPGVSSKTPARNDIERDLMGPQSWRTRDNGIVVIEWVRCDRLFSLRSELGSTFAADLTALAAETLPRTEACAR